MINATNSLASALASGDATRGAKLLKLVFYMCFSLGGCLVGWVSQCTRHGGALKARGRRKRRLRFSGNLGVKYTKPVDQPPPPSLPCARTYIPRSHSPWLSALTRPSIASGCAWARKVAPGMSPHWHVSPPGLPCAIRSGAAGGSLPSGATDVGTKPTAAVQRSLSCSTAVQQARLLA